MKHFLPHILAATLLLTLANACTHNNGNIGIFFGTWHLEEATADGNPVDLTAHITATETANQWYFQFQNSIIAIRLADDRLHNEDASYGHWEETDPNTLRITFPDPNTFYILLPGIDTDNTMSIVERNDNRLVLEHTDSHGIRDMKGGVVSTAKDAKDPQHNNSIMLKGRWLPVNFGIWWDGDLLRELLDHARVSKYDWKENAVVDLQQFDCEFNNGTKSNPCLAADILGDWREEVIARNHESTELRIFVTTIPTDHRINCLMQDIPYRLSVATQNVGYNQPSEPGFYLGPDAKDFLR